MFKRGVDSRVKSNPHHRIMQIGELACATGLSRDTLRFYEKRGQLARELERPGAGCPLDAQPETIA